MRYLLDTTALLAHYQAAPEAERLLELFDHGGHEFFLSVLSVVEFGRKLKELGVPPAQTRQTLASYTLLFNKVLPVDEEVARRALHLAFTVRPRLPTVDSLIAATAQHAETCLVHLDKHFAAIPNDALSQVRLSGA